MLIRWSRLAFDLNAGRPFILLTMLYVGSLCAAEKSTPTRQDCIQKVLFDWGDRSSEEIEETISEMGDAIRNKWMERDPNAITNIPDFSFPYARRSEWYLQYREGCDRKRSQTVELIEQVLGPSISRMPDYIVIDEQVIPSPRTIDVRGEQWEKDDY